MDYNPAGTDHGRPRCHRRSPRLEAVLRADRGRLLAALIARLRDFQLAEDALQDAADFGAGRIGARSGLPASPQGWLLRVALRKAIDRLRRGAARQRRKRAALAAAGRG